MPFRKRTSEQFYKTLVGAALILTLIYLDVAAPFVAALFIFVIAINFMLLSIKLIAATFTRGKFINAFFNFIAGATMLAVASYTAKLSMLFMASMLPIIGTHTAIQATLLSSLILIPLFVYLVLPFAFAAILGKALSEFYYAKKNYGFNAPPTSNALSNVFLTGAAATSILCLILSSIVPALPVAAASVIIIACSAELIITSLIKFMNDNNTDELVVVTPRDSTIQTSRCEAVPRYETLPAEKALAAAQFSAPIVACPQPSAPPAGHDNPPKYSVTQGENYGK